MVAWCAMVCYDEGVFVLLTHVHFMCVCSVNEQLAGLDGDVPPMSAEFDWGLFQGALRLYRVLSGLNPRLSSYVGHIRTVLPEKVAPSHSPHSPTPSLPLPSSCPDLSDVFVRSFSLRRFPLCLEMMCCPPSPVLP